MAPQQRIPFCANSISCIKDLSGKYESANTGVFMGKRVASPLSIAQEPKQNTVLGESTGGEKHIYVDLTNQRLYAYEGKKLIYSFLVSTGKWRLTPTGDFHIWIKLRYTRMTGGNSAIGTYYNLPNVPYTMFFYNSEHPKSEGFGMHGAYWHHNWGHPMSHGCINMDTADVEKLYTWADGPVGYGASKVNGTPLTIYGATPIE